MTVYICKYCGKKATSVQSLASSFCTRHPNGPGKGRHAVYEGDEKTEYVCKFCGRKFSSIQSMSANFCLRHPNGSGKGRHEPML
ncbi:MAG TPA: C2H2-type zinc finger protein [Candidatus Hydrogenedens sp.]|nr:C2H2-type zinc finger protein [Candidatus Hydrogenedens sp.]HOK08567.1 C2H2-type zinc finger protein [Candidatus Hydrogenedens sp.]HOL19055.1 C2H2-type zinc finger protein [Candidatus Hydrogenedens sp.]HPP57763.1 C2H2-type zinc finger protein [Candidatus Hydrogenedens sp.]